MDLVNQEMTEVMISELPFTLSYSVSDLGMLWLYATSESKVQLFNNNTFYIYILIQLFKAICSFYRVVEEHELLCCVSGIE